MKKVYRYWSFREKVYIAKFYEYDGCVKLADAFDVDALDVVKCYKRLRQNGKLNRYRDYWDRLYKWNVYNKD